jgi:hypothetical protein
MLSSSTGTGQFAPVLRGVQAGVVAQVDGRVAQTGGKSRSVVQGLIVGLRAPLQIVHAQAVHQQHHFASGLGQGQRGLQVERCALAAQCHWRGQRVVVGGQVVAQHAIERGQHGLALRRLWFGAVSRLQQRLQLG